MLSSIRMLSSLAFEFFSFIVIYVITYIICTLINEAYRAYVRITPSLQNSLDQ